MQRSIRNALKHWRRVEPVTGDRHVPELSDWRQYVPFWNPSSPLPIVEESFQHFRLSTKHGTVYCKSMLTILELAYLYHVARDQYAGHGHIVDLGPYCGVGTFALASGLSNSSVPMGGKIFSYDLFLVEGYDWFFDAGMVPATRSVFPTYMDVVRDYVDHIVPVPGDLLRMKWIKEPIEIVFVDIAKSWALNNWVLSETFPYLLPGKSVVIQQDYCHFIEWWLQVLMEYFSDRFEFLEVIKGASAIFKCIAPISCAEAQRDLSQLSLSEKIRLMERAAARVPAPAAEMLKCGRAQCFVEHGEYGQAEKLLQTVTTSRMTDRPELDFSDIAPDNVAKVRKAIAQRR